MERIETRNGRFWMGGVGASLPLIVSLCTADLAPLIDHPEALTPGQWIGHGIQYIALFVLGGFIAMLQSDEKHPMKLLQIGVAAPALIAHLIASSPGGGKQTSMEQVYENRSVAYRFINSANAAEMKPLTSDNRPPGMGLGNDNQLATTPENNPSSTTGNSFWSDVLDGLTHPLPKGVKPLFFGQESDPPLGLVDRACRYERDMSVIPDGEGIYNTEVELSRVVSIPDLPAIKKELFTVGASIGPATPTVSLSLRNGCSGYVAEVTVGKPRDDQMLPVNVAFEMRQDDGIVKTFKGQIFARRNEKTKVTQWGDVIMTIVVR